MRTRTVVHGRKWDQPSREIDLAKYDPREIKYIGKTGEPSVVSPNILGVAFGYVAGYMSRRLD